MINFFSLLINRIYLIFNRLLKFFTNNNNHIETNNNNNIVDKMDDQEDLIDLHEKEFIFRPFKLVKININSDKNGNIVPAPRSGHRIVCNDGNMLCFGGFNPDYHRQGRQFLFHELWKFNKYREQWSLVLDSQSEMPRQLASNAVILEGDMMMVYFKFL